MAKKGKTGKNRKDKFYQLAKEQGYRSRASFKLVQLNRRYDVLSTAARGVLDLCAAPGGWLQVARKYMPLTAPCIGVDLVPIRGVPNCITLTEDITKESCRAAIRRELKDHEGADPKGKVDVVLNDGSPNMGAAWLQDAYTQADLTLSALKLATEFLAPGGTFITKVFRSNDYNTLLYIMNQLFNGVRATKPSASRAESAEIYVACTGFKAPKRIDPQLLDPKTVFQTMTDPKADERPKLPDNVKRKRNREGYEDGASVLFKKCSVADFVRSEEPLRVLNDFNELEFDKDNDDVQFLLELPETDDEVRAACADLKVLNRRDFKSLLRWRGAARTQLLNRERKGQSSGKPEEDGEEEEEDEDERLERELNERRAAIQAKEKREKKRKAKLRSKIQQRIDLKMDIPGDQLGDDDGETTYHFTAANERANGGLAEAPVPNHVPKDEADHYAGSRRDDLLPLEALERGGPEPATYEDELEAQLDYLYGEYEDRRKKRSKSKKKDDAAGADEGGTFEEVRQDRKGVDGADGSDSDADSDADSDSDSELATEEVPDDSVADTGRAAGPRDVNADIWFSQPLLRNILEPLSEVEDDGERATAGRAARASGKGTPEKPARKRPRPSPVDKSVPSGPEAEEPDPLGEPFRPEDYTEEERAEIVASAAKIKLMKRRERLAVEDDSYNRYAYSDPENLPKWFAEEDERSRRKILPATKKDVEEAKERMRLLAGKATKKELEAKGRKRMREERRMDKLKKKMNAIAEEGDSNAASKLKAIEALIRKGAKKAKEPGKQYVVATGRGQKKVVGGDKSKGARIKYVDKRMKADRRGLQKAAKKGGKGGKR